MKKQILIFAMFTLALIFAGTNLYAQEAPNLSAAPATCLTPVPLDESCEGAHLTPSPGTPYVYTVNVSNLADLPGTTPAANITWVVTTSQTFIDGTGFIAVADDADGTGYIAAIGTGGVAYNTATAVDGTGNSSIQITWNAFTHDRDNPVFLVAYATDAGGTCTSDNMEAWIIEPQHSFTLDIANLALDGTEQSAGYETCVAPVSSAAYDGTNINFDYGVNYMFFQVVAANFSGSWQPSFQVGGDAFTGSRVATAVEWSVDGLGAWNAMTTSDDGANWTTTGNVPASGGSVGAAGECIVVRVTLANNQDETIASENVTLAVNGTMENPVDGTYTGDTYKDIDAENCTATDFDDIATQVLTPRPQIEEVQPTDPFVGTNRD